LIQIWPIYKECWPTCGSGKGTKAARKPTPMAIVPNTITKHIKYNFTLIDSDRQREAIA